jgi:hypothetical protein
MRLRRAARLDRVVGIEQELVREVEVVAAEGRGRRLPCERVELRPEGRRTQDRQVREKAAPGQVADPVGHRAIIDACNAEC